ncbi:MAG: integrase, partial [Clostridium sp.]|nr:integrase [Clostridium sp.]
MAITEEKIISFQKMLLAEERSLNTVRKYCQDIRQFKDWIGGEKVTKETLLGWKEFMILKGYKGTTINGKIISINTYFK